MCVKGLRALTRLGITGARSHARRQGRLAVCGPFARRWRQLVCLRAAPFWCGSWLGGIVFIAAVLVCVLKGCYGTRSPLKNIRARGRIIFLFFPRAARARAKNKANQQCHFKSSQCRMELLDTDSCHVTVPMEPPMSNSSMRHQNPDLDFDDTGHFLQGALCTIAACAAKIRHVGVRLYVPLDCLSSTDSLT